MTPGAHEPREQSEGLYMKRQPLVLVVDNVYDNREIYVMSLEYAGFRVEQASDGEGALTELAREKPVQRGRDRETHEHGAR